MEEMLTLALDPFRKKVKLQIKLKPHCPPSLSRGNSQVSTQLLGAQYYFVFTWVNTNIYYCLVYLKHFISSIVTHAMQPRLQARKLFFFFQSYRLVVFYQQEAMKARDKTRLNQLGPRWRAK